jgi:hypothetical protein
MDVAPDYHSGWVYHGLVVGPAIEASLLLRHLVNNRILSQRCLARMLRAMPLPRFYFELHPDPAYGVGLMRTATAPLSHPIGHNGGGLAVGSRSMHKARRHPQYGPLAPPVSILREKFFGACRTPPVNDLAGTDWLEAIHALQAVYKTSEACQRFEPLKTAASVQPSAANSTAKELRWPRRTRRVEMDGPTYRSISHALAHDGESDAGKDEAIAGQLLHTESGCRDEWA